MEPGEMGGLMGKCGTFEEIGLSGKAKILKLTEYPSNPLEPIKAFWEKYGEEIISCLKAGDYESDSDYYLMEAVRKCMVIVEGK